jgi:hypothetical protein
LKSRGHTSRLTQQCLCVRGVLGLLRTCPPFPRRISPDSWPMMAMALGGCCGWYSPHFPHRAHRVRLVTAVAAVPPGQTWSGHTRPLPRVRGDTVPHRGAPCAAAANMVTPLRWPSDGVNRIRSRSPAVAERLRRARPALPRATTASPAVEPEACPPGPVHVLRRALTCRTRLPALGTVGLFQSDRPVCCQ